MYRSSYVYMLKHLSQHMCSFQHLRSSQRVNHCLRPSVLDCAPLLRKHYYSQSSQETPFTGLPFVLTVDEANRIVLNNKKYLEDFKIGEQKALIVADADQANLPKECFLPFHSADFSNIVSSFTGRYGIDRTEWYVTTVYDEKSKAYIPETRYRTVTDWFDASGTLKSTSYPFGSRSTQIYAGFTYPRREIEDVLAKDDVVNIKPLTESMLLDAEKKKRYVYPHDMTISYALEKMIGKIHKAEVKRAENLLLKKFDADHAEVDDLQIDLGCASIQLKSYHLPVFIYKNVKNEVSMYKFVDGFNGKYEGEYALSTIKMFLVGTVPGILLASAPFFATIGPVSVGLTFGRILLSGVATGASSALYARFRHVYNKYTNTKDFEEATKHNQNYQATDDDQRRKEEAERFNQGYTGFRESDRYRFKNIDDDIGDKLTLLGLQKDKLPTEQELKKAYHDSVKKWHPDVYKKDPVLGNKMTLQINAAYQALLKVIKQ